MLPLSHQFCLYLQGAQNLVNFCVCFPTLLDSSLNSVSSYWVLTSSYIKLGYHSWSKHSQDFCDDQMKICREKYFRKGYHNTVIIFISSSGGTDILKICQCNILFLVPSLTGNAERTQK